MEVASTVAKLAETAEKVYEGTKEIRKVCNATQEAKTVADSEGKEQLDASAGMAYSFGKESSSFAPAQGGDAHTENGLNKASLDKGDGHVFDEGIPSGAGPEKSIKDASIFDDGIPSGAAPENPIKETSVFDEGFPIAENNQGLSEKEVKESKTGDANDSAASREDKSTKEIQAEGQEDEGFLTALLDLLPERQPYSDSLIQNKRDGLAREDAVLEDLYKKYDPIDGYDIFGERYLCSSDGQKAIDVETGSGRRIDFVVVKDGKVVDSVEVTSNTADKTEQAAKEERIRENGGVYIRNPYDSSLIMFDDSIKTRIERRA